MLTPFNRIYSIELDINGLEDVHLTKGKFTNGDRQTSTVLVRLIKDDAPLDLVDATVTAFFQCVDGNMYRQNTTILDAADGVVGVDLKSDVLIVGINAMALKVEKPNAAVGNNDVMYSPNMTYTVYRTILDGDEADDRLPLIEEILQELGTSMEELENLKDQVAEKIEEVEDLKNNINMDGFVRSVTVNGQRYDAVNNNVTLPNYPTLDSLDGAQKNHTHTADQVVAMTGYIKKTEKTPILETDTLNEAISKLENSIDDLAAGGGGGGTGGPYAPLDHNHDNDYLAKDENAVSASKLETARNIALQGDATGTASFDGTQDISINTTLSDTGVTANSYGQNTDTTATFGGTINIPQITVDSKGRITNAVSRIVTLPANPNTDTDTKVTNTPNATVKAYITGTTTETESTGTQVFDSKVYLDTEVGTLTADKFKGNLEGNASTATKADTADKATDADKLTNPVKITIGLTEKEFDGSTNLKWTLDEIGATGGGGTGGGNFAPIDHHHDDKYLKLDGNAVSASKLQTAVKINGTDFDGSKDITTEEWGTSRDITISDNDGTNVGTVTSINGSTNYTLKLPATIKANLTGKADSATTADTATTATKADTADKLTNARDIAISQDATGTASFDGSSNINIALTLSDSGVTAGSYGAENSTTTNTVKVPYIEVDSKGRVIKAENKIITVPQSTGGGGVTTDTMVTNTKDNTTKAYITGTTSDTTNTGEQIFDSTVYLDGEEGTLVAKKFKGDLDGNAATATNATTANTAITATTADNATTADKLKTSKNISISGDGTGTTSFDGSSNADIVLTLKDSGVTEGSYGADADGNSNVIKIPYITVDKKGIVTKVENKTITVPQSVNTDTMVTNEKNNTTKAYITGTTNADTNTGTQIFDTSVYLDTEEGSLVATKFKGNVEGKATSAATADSATNATTADGLKNSRDIQLTGDITGTASFNGTANAVINSTLATVTQTNTNTAEQPNPGDSFTAIGKVSVDTKGRVTGVETKTITLPNANTLTDEKVKNELKTTTKAYITATESATTNTGTQVFDSGVYLDTEAGTLVANKFKGNVEGSATSADKLKDPVNITIGNETKPFDGSTPLEWTESDLGLDGYLPLTGGTVTGSTTFEKGIISSDISEIKGMRSTEINPDTGYAYWSMSSTGTLTSQVLNIEKTSLLKGQVSLHNTIRGLKTDGSQSWSVDREGNSVFNTLTVNQQAKCFSISSTLANPPWSISDSGVSRFNSIGSYVDTNIWSVDGGGQAIFQKASVNGTTSTVNLKVTQDATIGTNLDVTGAIYGNNNIILNRDNVYTPIFGGNTLTDYMRLGGGFITCTDGGGFHFIKNGATSNTLIANGNLPLVHASNSSVLVDYIRLGNAIIAAPSSGTIHMQTAGAARTSLYVGNIINTYSVSKVSTISNENEESALDKINSVEVVNTQEGFRLTKGVEGNNVSVASINEETGEEEVNVDLNTAIATLWKAVQELKKENEELKNKLGM